MSTLASHARPSRASHWFREAEAWLDDKGKGAWIAMLVVSFILFWPVGLAILGYMIWSKKMICRTAHTRRARRSVRNASTGNSAFDAYREETLRRLEEEQHSFETFLQRLRDARDKAEFDTFMQDRATEASQTSQADTDTSNKTAPA